MLNEVPEIATVFWIVKIVSRTVGEAGIDGLAVHVGAGTAAAYVVTVSWLAAGLFLHICARRYVPWTCWFTVVLASIVGTQISDVLAGGLGGCLYASTAAFAMTLAGRHLRDRVRGPSAGQEAVGRSSRSHRPGERNGLIANPGRKRIQ